MTLKLHLIFSLFIKCMDEKIQKIFESEMMFYITNNGNNYFKSLGDSEIQLIYFSVTWSAFSFIIFQQILIGRLVMIS